MNTQEFITQLEPHAAKPLSFSSEGVGVPAGYHVTEIKSATISAMDCGGRAANWNELILQVLPPSAPSPAEQMMVGKFLGIYGRVADAVALPDDALVRVEYGAAGHSAVSYVVSAIATGPSGVTVELAPPTVACKANTNEVSVVPLAPALESLTPTVVADGPQDVGCCAPQGAGTSPSACCA